MKRIFTFLLIAAVSVATFIGCQQAVFTENLESSALENTENATVTDFKSQMEKEQFLALSCYDAKAIDLTKNCPRVIDPVCACGTITFMNACEASRAGFVNTTRGACAVQVCPNPIVKDVLAETGAECASVYQPVCGCDGKTYGNACVATLSGVTAYTPGECGSLGGLPITTN